jgi:hypothetical protein
MFHAKQKKRKTSYSNEGSFASHNIDIFEEEDFQEDYCGPMDEVCDHCGAKYWERELNSAKKYTTCCSSGKVRIPSMSPITPVVKELLEGKTSKWKNLCNL